MLNTQSVLLCTAVFASVILTGLFRVYMTYHGSWETRVMSACLICARYFRSVPILSPLWCLRCAYFICVYIPEISVIVNILQCKFWGYFNGVWWNIRSYHTANEMCAFSPNGFWFCAWFCNVITNNRHSIFRNTEPKFLCLRFVGRAFTLNFNRVCVYVALDSYRLSMNTYRHSQGGRDRDQVTRIESLCCR